MYLVMMRVGLTTDPANVAAALRAYPGMVMCRVFGAIGKGIPAWTNPAVQALTAANKIPWVSFKDWASDAAALSAVNSWADKMPATLAEVWLTYHHEPEGDIDPREFRRRWVKLAATVKAHRNRPRIKIVPIHTLYPSRHKIGDRFNVDQSTWVGTWQWWAPTDATGAYVGDYMGWDCYLETNATVYEAPERFFRIPVGAATAAGVPLVVPELGAVPLSGDSTGTGRARWITDCLTVLRLLDCQAVLWWNTVGSAGQDYTLRDSTGTAVWRKATEGLI